MTNDPRIEILLERSFPRTTRSLLDEYATPAYQGYQLEAWVFDDETERQATETAFKAADISARLRSAYKPLVHFFLEEFSWEALESLVIEYPALAHAPRRFLLEAYPLAALLPPGVALCWEEVDATPTTISTTISTLLYYRVRVERSTGELETYWVEAPNRQHLDHVDEAQCSPCGWPLPMAR